MPDTLSISLCFGSCCSDLLCRYTYNSHVQFTFSFSFFLPYHNLNTFVFPPHILGKLFRFALLIKDCAFIQWYPFFFTFSANFNSAIYRLWLSCNLFLLQPVFISWHFKNLIISIFFSIEAFLLVCFWFLVNTEGNSCPSVICRNMFFCWDTRSFFRWVLVACFKTNGLNLILITLNMIIITFYPVLKQHFSILAFWTFGQGQFFMLGGCPISCKRFSSA